MSAQEGPRAPAAAPAIVHGLDLAAINPDVRPGDDFFQYANGRWLALTKIPPDRSSLGVFDQLTELTTKRLAELIRATL
ncbi:MAG TPA: hypothetical protein VME21_16190, partial [Steroidobacteraceae bacterium]|nr:hypothetical protein [Steroidobacteraceae bacterium]